MSTSPDFPLISCLCITTKRASLLKKSIQCFLDQSYPNKELIVVYPVEDAETATLLQTFSEHVIALPVENTSGAKLGGLRNYAIRESAGKYFCVWDDDDWFHPERLMTQFNSLIMAKAKACALSRILLYDGVTQKAHVSGRRQAWEGTLLCEKTVIDASILYADLRKGEDTVLVSALLHHRLVVSIDNPELYIYTHHGRNTWSRSHWEINVIGWGKELSEDVSEALRRIVNGETTAATATSVLAELSL